MRAIGLALVLLSIAAPASAQDWYDAGELVRAHVREAQRADLPAQLEVSDLAATNRAAIHRTHRSTARVFAHVIVPTGSSPPVLLLRGACLDGVRCIVSQVSRSVWRVAPASPIPPGGHLRVELDVTGVVRELDESQMSMMAQGMQSMASMQGG